MTFKSNWEKTDELHQIAPALIKAMTRLAFPDTTLSDFLIISGGCANLNIKISLADRADPLILRVYIRDPAAAEREQQISTLVHAEIPVPEFYYLGDHAGYKFAFMGFIQGITLRDLLLSTQKFDLVEIMYKVGILLSKIAGYHLPSNKIFRRNDTYISFALDTFKELQSTAKLETTLMRKIKQYLDDNLQYFPDENERYLVHADFDPSNILITNIDDAWKITGVLDWEFSFSGSVLCDVATMLRYAHEMPNDFTAGFISGLNHGGIILPVDWSYSVKLLNLMFLMHCAVRANPVTQPQQYADIYQLIHHITR